MKAASSKHSSIVEIMKDTLMRTNSNSSTTSTSVNPMKKPVSSDVQSSSSEKIIPQREINVWLRIVLRVVLGPIVVHKTVELRWIN